MLGWALLLNNLGRRRYPIYWWTPESTLVVGDTRSNTQDEEKKQIRESDVGELGQAESGLNMTAAIFDARFEGEMCWHKASISHTGEHIEGDVLDNIIRELGRRDIAAHWK